jgi:hypothetical protein
VLVGSSATGSVPLLTILPALGVSAGLHVLMLVGFALMFLVGPGKGEEKVIEQVPDVVAMDDEPKRVAEIDDRPIVDPTDPNPGNPEERGILPEPLFGPLPPEVGPIIPVFDPKLPGSLSSRTSNESKRLKKAIDGGGNEKSERAVAAALRWLSLHQAHDGHWAMDDFQHHVVLQDEKSVAHQCNCEGSGIHDNIAGTGLALLPFLGAGLTPDTGQGEMYDYTKQILKGLEYLRQKQFASGRFAEGGPQDNQQLSMYNHAIATICMSEAASLYPKEWVRNSAQSALNFLAKVQDPDGGGWRYGPSPQPGDASVVGWCLMALKSGQLAGLRVSPKTLQKVRHFFDSVEVETRDGTFYGYMDGQTAKGNRTLTAVGLLSGMYLGWKRDDPKLLKGWRWLRDNTMPDAKGPTDLYFQYYATQVMRHMGGNPDDTSDKTKEFRDGWKQWNDRMRDMLVARQDQGTGPHAHQQGSWSPGDDKWCKIGGRLMMTSLCTLTLEVYYRHLPLYRTPDSE